MSSPDNHNGERPDSSSISGLRCVVIAFVIYVGIFVTFLVDEMVLKTYWLYHHLPRSSDDPIRLIYTPLLWLLSRVTGMPHP